jgi:hypothetical protein
MRKIEMKTKYAMFTKQHALTAWSEGGGVRAAGRSVPRTRLHELQPG